jgi:hypothetical protein
MSIGRAGLHIGAHVGDRDQQAPALAAADLGRLAVDGIVEVACVLAVDGDQRHVGQVDAAFLVLRTHLVGSAFASARPASENSCGTPYLRTAISISMPGSSISPKHFLDATDRLAEQRRRLGELHDDDLPHLGGARRSLGDQDVLAVALVFRRDEPDAAFVQQPADDGCSGRSTISTTRPSGRPRRSCRTTRALTRSLCSTARISFGGR